MILPKAREWSTASTNLRWFAVVIVVVMNYYVIGIAPARASLL